MFILIGCSIAIHLTHRTITLEELLVYIDSECYLNLRNSCLQHSSKLISVCSRFLWLKLINAGPKQGTPADIFGQVLDSDAPDSVLPTDVNNETEERETGILQDEERSEGTVKLDVYSAYWKAVGLYVTPIILASLLLMQTSKNVCDWWLAHWVSPSVDNTTNVTSSQDPVFYLSVYGGIAAANSVFTLIRAFAFAYGGLKAAELIHKRLMDTILKVLFPSFIYCVLILCYKQIGICSFCH